MDVVRTRLGDIPIWEHLTRAVNYRHQITAHKGIWSTFSGVISFVRILDEKDTHTFDCKRFTSYFAFVRRFVFYFGRYSCRGMTTSIIVA